MKVMLILISSIPESIWHEENGTTGFVNSDLLATHFVTTCILYVVCLFFYLLQGSVKARMCVFVCWS